jgi:hypothetical protein
MPAETDPERHGANTLYAAISNTTVRLFRESSGMRGTTGSRKRYQISLARPGRGSAGRDDSGHDPH